MVQTETEEDEETKEGSFGPIHIINPKSDHTHTAIMLHGRGSTGQEFAQDFLESTLSDETSLPEKLSGYRWVFPSSQELWSTAFQETMPAWFEAHSLTDITMHQHLQISGLRDSVGHVVGIIDQEVERLDGDPQRLVLGGISQGGAIGLWTILCLRNAATRPGAVVVTNTWLPFADNIGRVISGEQMLDSSHQDVEFDSFVEQMMIVKSTSGVTTDVDQDLSRLSPVFIGHGVDDAYVDVALGRQAACVLSQAGMLVEWREYAGAEEEGHWFKVPEEMDDILQFLIRVG
jgi:lysophospholipase-2